MTALRFFYFSLAIEFFYIIDEQYTYGKGGLDGFASQSLQ